MRGMVVAKACQKNACTYWEDVARAPDVVESGTRSVMATVLAAGDSECG